MARYEIQFANSAAREFRELPEEIKSRVSAAVEALKENPRPRGFRKIRSRQGLYRIRVGQYRAVYEIDDRQKLIVVTRVRHRQEAYR